MDILRRLFNFIFGQRLPCHKYHSGGKRYRMKPGVRVDCPYCSRSYLWAKSATFLRQGSMVDATGLRGLNGHDLFS